MIIHDYKLFVYLNFFFDNSDCLCELTYYALDRWIFVKSVKEFYDMLGVLLTKFWLAMMITDWLGTNQSEPRKHELLRLKCTEWPHVSVQCVTACWSDWSDVWSCKRLNFRDLFQLCIVFSTRNNWIRRLKMYIGILWEFVCVYPKGLVIWINISWWTNWS